ncbi:hypothetical protein ACVW1C_002620 [Bradyrhizobium sp. USDA 4011]
MSKTSFHRQCLRINQVDAIRHQITHGKAVSGNELASAVEELPGCDLPPELRELFNHRRESSIKGSPRTATGSRPPAGDLYHG